MCKLVLGIGLELGLGLNARPEGRQESWAWRQPSSSRWNLPSRSRVILRLPPAANRVRVGVGGRVWVVVGVRIGVRIRVRVVRRYAAQIRGTRWCERQHGEQCGGVVQSRRGPGAMQGPIVEQGPIVVQGPDVVSQQRACYLSKHWWRGRGEIQQAPTDSG